MRCRCIRLALHWQRTNSFPSSLEGSKTGCISPDHPLKYFHGYSTQNLCALQCTINPDCKSFYNAPGIDNATLTCYHSNLDATEMVLPIHFPAMTQETVTMMSIKRPQGFAGRVHHKDKVISHSSPGLRGYFAYQEAAKTAPIKIVPVYHHMMPGSLRPLPDLPATVAGITATQVKT